MKNSINGNANFVAKNDNHIVNNYYSDVAKSENEFGVINDIFSFVLTEAQDGYIDTFEKAYSKDKLIHIKEKIKINFKEETKEVQAYFITLYSKIILVEKSFSALEEDNQREVHFYISSKYHDLKRKKLNAIEILKKLPEFFVPPKFQTNPTYMSIAQSIVLFFFDDCTIFEKTSQESVQTDLFEKV